MNIIDVIKLARKSNIRSPDGYKLTVSHMSIEDLQRFAKLVAATEREACAKLAESGVNADQYPTLTLLAQCIRMRGD